MKYYTVYLRKTDELVAAGTARDCAKALNKSLNGFHSMVSKNLTGKHKKYEIIVLDAEDDEELEEE